MVKTTDMLVVVISLICYAYVVAPLQLSSKDFGEDFTSMGGRAVAAILEKTSQPNCSVIFFTDGVSSNLDIYMESGNVLSPWGMTVLEVPQVSFKRNSTENQFLLILEHARRVRLSSWCVTVVVSSLDVDFLEAFAEWSDRGHLLEWTTRIVVLTSLTHLEIQDLLSNRWTFSMMNAMLVSLDHASSQNKFDVYSYVPYYPGGSRVVRVATWSGKHGLSNLPGYSLFPEKYDNFYGSDMNMTVFPFPPYWMSIEYMADDGTVVPTLTGRDYIMLETLSGILNFSINVLPDGDWDEVMKRLEDRVAFLSPVKLAIMPHMLKLYDFTLYIERATLGFSMAKPTLKPRWQSLYYPLTEPVWLSILAVLFLVPAVLWTINRLGTYSNEKNCITAGIVMQEIIGSLLAQTMSKRWPTSTSTRILLCTWFMFAVIVGTAYRGNLTAFLTIPKYPDRPETVKQMVHVGANLTMPPDLVDFYESFKTSESALFQTLAERTIFVPDFEAGMQASLEQNSAYIYERFFMELMIVEHFTDIDGSTRLYVARENIMPGYCGWPMIKNAPFKPNLNRYITAFHEAGLVEKWSYDILKRARLNSRKKQLEETEVAQEKLKKETAMGGGGIMALTLIHMQGPLFLLILGLLLSSGIFTAEVVGHLCIKRIKTNLV